MAAERLRRRVVGWVAVCMGYVMGLAAGNLPGHAAEPEVVTLPKLTLGLGSLRDFAASPDGRRLVSVSESGAFLWDLGTGALLRVLGSEGAPLNGLAFSPDSRRVLVAGRDLKIRAWDLETGRMEKEYVGHSLEISGLAFHPDGGVFASSSGDNTIRVWDVDSGAELRQMKVPGVWMQTVAFSADGKLLVSGEGAPLAALRVWDAATGEPVHRLEAHAGETRRFAPLSGGRMASIGLDRTVRIWDVARGELLRTVNTGTHQPMGLVSAPDGSQVVTASLGGSLMSWDADSGEGREIVASATRGFTALARAQSGSETRLILAGADELIRVHDASTGALVRMLEGHTGGNIQGVAMSADGEAVYSGGVELWTRQWNGRTGSAGRVYSGHPSGTAAVAVSSDGGRLITTLGGANHAVRVWRTATGVLERELEGSTDWILAAVFSPDGRRVAAGGYDRAVIVWDVETGAQLHRLTGHTASVRALAFSPDGRELASGGDDHSVRVWDLATEQPLPMTDEAYSGIRAVAFAPSGRELMGATEDGRVLFWEPSSGKVLRVLSVPAGYLEDAVYSPDGRFLLTGESWPFFVARLWDASTLEPLRIFAGHTAGVGAVAFSGNGRMIATGADVVRLWNIGDLTGQAEIARIEGGLEVRWWRGILERAERPEGPWVAVEGASSPWRVSAIQGNGFFRIRRTTPGRFVLRADS
jgi:WD40 repeat protein